MDPCARPTATELGRAEFEPPADDLGAALRTAFSGPPARVALPDQAWLATDVVPVPREASFVDLTVILDLPWEQTARYEHSKLYFAYEDPFDFSESRVICFRIRWVRRVQTVRLQLPAAVRGAAAARFRLDPFPYCAAGTAYVHSLRFVCGDPRDEASRVAADLRAEGARAA